MIADLLSSTGGTPTARGGGDAVVAGEPSLEASSID
jgi:hypothetical protein